jgi:hypothetical protein
MLRNKKKTSSRSVPLAQIEHAATPALFQTVSDKYGNCNKHIDNKGLFRGVEKSTIQLAVRASTGCQFSKKIEEETRHLQQNFRFSVHM